MDLEITLREVSSGLRSVRVTERKKSAESLKDYLTRNAVPSLLSNNTLKDKGYTWNHLFEDVTEYILKETEKYETSKTYGNVTAPLCTNLLHLCVAGSNKGKSYINCEKITESCLYILNDMRLSRAIGDAYLNLLFKHVLPNENYLGHITPNTWKELLVACIAACASSSFKTDDFTKLRLLLLVIRSGKENCQFTRSLVNTLPSLEQYLSDVGSDKKVQDVIIEIIVVLLETLASEYRLTMCNFIEKMLSPLLKCYDQNKDYKKKNMLFKLLELAVGFHHPQGRHQHEEGSLANNWELWNKYLNSISEIICLEVAYLKLRKQNDRNLQQCSNLHHLAASVYYQIFYLNETVYSDVESTAKRVRLNINKSKTFGDIINEMQRNYIPWLGVINIYLKKYGESITPKDYISLLNCLHVLLTNNNPHFDWIIFEELVSIALDKSFQVLCSNDEYNNTLISFWNSCVRNCTSINASHKPIHMIIQSLLKQDVITYQHAQNLIKLYLEKDMPVTTCSIQTMNIVFKKIYSKCSSNENRALLLLWLQEGDITNIGGRNYAELIFKLIADENIKDLTINTASSEYNELRHIIFDSLEKCILFTEFELAIPKRTKSQDFITTKFETITKIEVEVLEFLKRTLIEHNSKEHTKDVDLIGYINMVSAILSYLDFVLKYNLKNNIEVNNLAIYKLTRIALTEIFSSLNVMLQSKTHNIPSKIKTIQLLKDMLLYEFHPILSNVIRSAIDADLFHTINNVLNAETQHSDIDIIIEGDEDDMGNDSLKNNCMLMLAAYCRKDAEYREDILKLVLDESSYNLPNDMQSVFDCIALLIDSNVYNPPIALIFSLMQYMCRKLYKNSKASFGILKILNAIINPLWATDNSTKNRDNCLIMIKSYLRLCEDMYYPPQVVSLVYECVAKIIVLDYKPSSHVDKDCIEAFRKKIKGDIHSIRLFCCYLLKLISKYLDQDMDAFSTDLLDIYLIDIPDVQELLIKDESANRTFTLLHCYLALAQTNKSNVQNIILQIINLQKQKSLDNRVTTKVLEQITNFAGIKDIDTYLNNNILIFVEFWISKHNNIKDVPFALFGFDNIGLFIEKHMKWLVAGDILWKREGNIAESDILKQVAKKHNQSVENILETCFSNVIALCLPYIVSKQYNLDGYGYKKNPSFKKSMQYASHMFQLMGEILENDRWSNLFVQNVGELLLLTVVHMSDPEEAKQVFGVELPKRMYSFYYPKRIFNAILEYFENLTEGSVIQYLCRNQTITIFKILFELWKAVTQESIFEWKVLALHAYIAFTTNIPLGFPSDAFMCNFACTSFTQVINNCTDKKEMKVYIQGLRIILDYLLPHKGNAMRKSLLKLLTVLTIKKEEGFEQECAPFLHYIVNDMKDYLKESEDVVDFLNTMSEDFSDNLHCHNLTIFIEKLKTHKTSLNCPSHETLMNIRQFLTYNKDHIQKMYSELENKRFSEDCETSAIHQIVHALCNVTKSGYDDKTIIEACNCLSEICSYDLKTLVTVSPADSEKITSVNPKLYFVQEIVRTLVDVLFDEDPTVTCEISETLDNLMKTIDIEEISNLDEIDTQILKPFISSSRTKAVTTVDSLKFEEYASEYPDGIFLQTYVENSEVWLKQVTSTLLEFVHCSTKYEINLRRVCALKSQVCQKILPSLMGFLLQDLSEIHLSVISGHIKNFFNYIWDQTFDDKLENSGDSTFNLKTTGILNQAQKSIIQHMLDIVDFVRMQRNYYRNRVNNAMKILNYLGLDYSKVAWAASAIDQNWAALYYGELWATFQNNGVSPHSPDCTINITGGDNLLRIFRKCYVSIGEIDAIEGCGTAHLTIESEKRKHLINTGQFTDALLLYDIALSSGGQVDQNLFFGVVKSLHKSGMHRLALQYIKTMPENDQLNDVKYECLSFLGDWSDFVDVGELEEKYKQTNYNPNSVVKAFQYTCLKNCLTVATTPEHEIKLLSYLNKAKLAVSRMCRNINMENCQNIYKILEKLHIFNDIEDYLSVAANRSELFDLLKKWDVSNLPQFNDFKHIEALSSQRVIILEQAAKSHGSLLNEILSLQIQYAKLALSNNRVQMAQRLLAVAKKSKWTEDVALVESEVSWAKGHKEIALSLVRNIVNNPKLDVKLAAVSLRRYALWMADSKRDNPRDIISKYLQKSVDLLKNGYEDVRLKVYHDIAKFADAEYKQVVTYMSSSAFENRVKCVENMEGTASSLSKRNTKLLTKEENRALSTNRKFKELDEAEIQNTCMVKENFLHLAMRYYLLSLKQCDENQLSVFRVISLWLSNQGFKFQDYDKESFEDLLHAIPSWKFVTVLPQLTPRLTNEDTPFNKNLKKIIQRCAIDHPHHTLPILFGLKNSDKDSVINVLNASGPPGQSNASGSNSRANARGREQEPRVVAAQALVAHLRDYSDDLCSIIVQMEKMCDAIISFANFMPTSKQKKQKIPESETLHKLRNLSALPVPTIIIPIRMDCKYTDFHSLHAFDSYFELVGGVNCPKKINCKDSSGRANVILIKGGDDLKQDAVMQQVFNIVNTLLENNPVTNRNKLLIRTYKVVPMSRLSGVLEWCEGTIPMGTYLVGTENRGAHGRYRPQDISCDVARKKIIDCANSSHEERLSVYNRIMREFKPVFHYFFTEHYLDPVTWYERRLAYTKSVATSSMVGYVLGLGDRHVFNILIDQRTAEVIHIDLGIAFDQGKTLRTPETVPFRLTRDIIAGFGASGTEGTFRRCCEKTMQLLRDNQETLLTILEVLLCDPLYSWSVKTAQQNAPTASRNTSTVCGSGGSGGAGLAERALLVVTSKLSGAGGGAPGGVAVPGLVARLLHSATDPFNLCRLFHGWQAYL